MSSVIYPKECDRILNRNNGMEKLTSEFTPEKDILAYHVSDEPINYLAVYQPICLYPSVPNNNEKIEGTIVERKFVYEITIPAGTDVFCYGKDEYRVLVNWDTKGRLIGYMDTVRFEKPRRNPLFRHQWDRTGVIFNRN